MPNLEPTAESEFQEPAAPVLPPARKAQSINTNKAFDIFLLDEAPGAQVEPADEAAGPTGYPRQSSKLPARTKELPKPQLVAAPLLVATQTLNRMADNAPLFSSLGSFLPSKNADALRDYFGTPADTRFKLGQKEIADGIAFQVSGSGEVRFARTADKKGFVIEVSAPFDLLPKGRSAASEGGYVSVSGARNVAFSYEQGAAKWQTSDPAEASRLLEAALGMLALKASLDKALAEGLANRVWHETDKLRHMAVGSGAIMKNEYPALGRDQNDSVPGEPFTLKLAPYLKPRTDHASYAVGQYLAKVAGVHALLVPRTDVVLLVPEALVGKALDAVPVGQRVALHFDDKGAVQVAPLERDEALQKLAVWGRNGSGIALALAKSVSKGLEGLLAGAEVRSQGAVSYAVSPAHALDVPSRSAFQTRGRALAQGRTPQPDAAALYRPAHTRINSHTARTGQDRG